MMVTRARRSRSVGSTGSSAVAADHGTLEIHELTKTYGEGAPAVKSVDLTVARGEFLTLLGPSGSGKTTILKLVAGFVAPTSGRILIDGGDVTGLPPRDRQIGMVLQNYALFPHMTVRGNVEYGLKMRSWGKQERAARVEEMLEVVGLTGYERRLPRELSGGQQQRVALARALAFDPALLLMDEPLGALDRELRVRMTAELRRIHAELGTTVVYVTHDRDEAISMSDRIALMHGGVMQGMGTPRDLYERPASKFVATFFGSHNLLPGHVIEVDGDAGLDAHSVTIQCLNQKVAVVCERDRFATGDSVFLVVPAERLRLAEGVGPHFAIEGSVQRLVYLGRNQELVCKTEEGHEVLAYLPVGNECPSEGGSVQLEADLNHLTVVDAR